MSLVMTRVPTWSSGFDNRRLVADTVSTVNRVWQMYGFTELGVRCLLCSMVSRFSGFRYTWSWYVSILTAGLERVRCEIGQNYILVSNHFVFFRLVLSSWSNYSLLGIRMGLFLYENSIAITTTFSRKNINQCFSVCVHISRYECSQML